MDNLTVDQMQLFLAALERECDCGMSPDCTHKGGRIPLLDVREPCPGIWQRVPGVDAVGQVSPPEEHSPHCHCQGRGWTPKRGLEAYVEAALSLGISVSWEANGYRTCWLEEGMKEPISSNGPPLQLSFFSALTQALKPLACNWEQTEEMARRGR